MATDRIASAAAGALLVGLGAFAGSWGGARVAGSRAREVPTAAIGPEDERPPHEALEGAAAELRAVAAELRDALARIGTGEASERAASRSPLAPAGEHDARDELAAAVRELSAAVETLRANASRSSAPRQRATTPAERAAAFDLQTLRETLASGNDEAYAAARQRLLAEHMMWTYDDVLAAYGRPDEVSAPPNYMRWIYVTSAPGSSLEQITFDFRDGRVIRMNYNRDE